MPNGVFCKPFDSQRVTRLLKANFHSEFYLHRQSLLFVFFTVLFFLSSSLLSPIILFSTTILFSLYRPRIRPSPYPLHAFPVRRSLLSVIFIFPLRHLYFPSPSSLSFLSIFSISPLVPSIIFFFIIYFLSSFPSFCPRVPPFPSLSSSIFSHPSHLFALAYRPFPYCHHLLLL